MRVWVLPDRLSHLDSEGGVALGVNFGGGHFGVTQGGTRVFQPVLLPHDSAEQVPQLVRVPVGNLRPLGRARRTATL